MAHPYCAIEEPAVTQLRNCLPVGLAGAAKIFRLDEQECDLSKQVGIVRFSFEGLTVECNRFASAAAASPTGGSCGSLKDLISI